ncbi:MAG: HlyD family secretion protein [Chitinophagaceae bacterium]|nr:HlyD family secretion protein [Chitinophagaceae bacterium]
MRILLILVFGLMMVASCGKKTTTEEEATTTSVQTPVTVTTVSNETLTDYIELNATSTFLQSSYIKSTANGYVETVNLKPGQFVGKGQLAFILKTKEAKALGNLINSLDKSFKFSGIINIYTSEAGYINQLNHQAGDYVQDGEQLAVVSNSNSFGFLLNLPFELRQYLNAKRQLDLELPDKTHLHGYVAQIMPEVDSASQTLAVLIKVNSTVPQNLVARVRIIKNMRENVPAVPKEAVLTDEAQTNFWVMKMIDSVTAVKTPIIKGMEDSTHVEIIRPIFMPSDRILISGNYGLPDTAKVKIVKQ